MVKVWRHYEIIQPWSSHQFNFPSAVWCSSSKTADFEFQFELASLFKNLIALKGTRSLVFVPHRGICAWNKKVTGLVIWSRFLLCAASLTKLPRWLQRQFTQNRYKSFLLILENKWHQGHTMRLLNSRTPRRCFCLSYWNVMYTFMVKGKYSWLKPRNVADSPWVYILGGKSLDGLEKQRSILRRMRAGPQKMQLC